jgi:dolichyl-phosphate beta-glucosyltransferase
VEHINIIIPCFNEENRIIRTLQAYVKYFQQNKVFSLSKNINKKFFLNLILVNDGSTDNTATVISAFIKKYNISAQIVNLQSNMGKGYAVKTGILESNANYYYICDSDMSASWSILPQFLNILKNEKVDYVVGSRALPESEVNTLPTKKILGRVSSFFIRNLLHIDIQDTQCGYKLFSHNCKKAFKLQKLTRWGFDFEIIYILNKLNFTHREVGIKWQHVPNSKVKIVSYLQTFKDLIKVRLTKYELDNDKE